MHNKWMLIALLLVSLAAGAQDTLSGNHPSRTPADTAFLPEMDTSFDYDDFFNEMENFLDSLLRPASYLQVSVRMGTGYYNYKVPNRPRVNSRNRFVFTPGITYYNRSGVGITVDADVIPETGTGLYQAVITPSYDYLRNLDFSTGISFSRYIHKSDLPFYLSPLQNEVSAYFVYRRRWLWPSISASFAWGNSSDYQERIDYVRLLRLRRRLTNAVNDQPHVNDLSITAAVSHNFYRFALLSKKDFFRITPQLLLNAGTQQFGFNSNNSGSLLSQLRRNGSVNSSRSFDLNATKSFEALSAALLVKATYSLGKFFIQPQATLDYYFPASDHNLSLLAAVNTGFNF